MPLDVVQGESRNRALARTLAETLQEHIEHGTVYLGYPVVSTPDEKVDVDALLVSRDAGVVAFLLADGNPEDQRAWDEAVADQDRLFAVLESNLSRYDALRDRRRFAVRIETATVFPSRPLQAESSEVDGFYGTFDDLPDWLEGLEPIGSDLEHAVQAALQRVTTIKPRKRRASVSRTDSRGAKLREIERGIANLDQWQKAAAIESPDGPQRIRGLAGSGKTVVLALKAAYWHTQHPEWNIALTFHSRALYQQINELVTRFTFEHSNDQPDASQLHIVHSWGSRSRAGMYSMMAEAVGEVPRDWNYAKAKFGQDGAFQGICRELLTVAEASDFEPIFDAVLIDEAQDLPPEFFQLVYAFTKRPKRITWGYDELQKLSEAAMPSTDEMFGTTSTGGSRVTLDTAPGEPRRDIVLPVCYRNTPWALATAHALGLGIYRTEGLLQHPDSPSLWLDIGYTVVEGSLVPGAEVTLERRADSFPPYFPSLLEPGDAVSLASFETQDKQDAWVAAEIARNLDEDELDHDDILVVLPESLTSRARANSIGRSLRRYDIPSHLVGVGSSADEVFIEGSIAISHIYRAKGNEAPMVYVVDSQKAAPIVNAVTRRNTLFTAITRSRAWVRIAGWGEQMRQIQREVEKVREHHYQLQFEVPTPARLAELRHIHRDRSPDEEASVLRATAGLSAFLEAVERGDADWTDFPADLRERLERLAAGDLGEPDS